MQAAENAVTGTRHVILDEGSADAAVGVTAELIGFQEEAAMIAKKLGFND
jgi:hypothetical protein